MKEFAEILSAFGTMIIAGIVAYVVYRQHKNDSDKLRLDLFDRRFPVYESLNTLLTHIRREDNITREALAGFDEKRRIATFLFGNDISSYLDEVYKKATMLHYRCKRLYGDEHLPEGAERSKVAEECEGLVNWLANQFDVSKKKFSRYLRFSTRE